MELKDVKDLIQIVDEAQIGELEIEYGEFKLKIRKFPAGVSLPAVAVQPVPGQTETQAQVQSQYQPSPAPKEAKLPADVVEITSPMVGTFYRAPAPDADPYVKLGDRVEPGQVLFIIEAMKMMNEIEAEHRGKVLEFLVENGESVEYGQPLIRLQLTD